MPLWNNLGPLHVDDVLREESVTQSEQGPVMMQSMVRGAVDLRRQAFVAAAVILTFGMPPSAALAQTLGSASGRQAALVSGAATDGDAVVDAQRDESGGEADLVPERLRRQVVTYYTSEAAGTIVIDTPNTMLYYLLGNNRAIRYGVGVGREGFTWSGTQSITRKAEWPDWHPPAEMIARQPYLPRFMAGGPGNPLGARAMYLGSSVYRIHGTNDPATIGKFVSSGCIRLTNADVADLFGRVDVGTRVVVLPSHAAPRLERKVTSRGLQRQAVNLIASRTY